MLNGNKIIICGKAGSGKDIFKERFVKKGFKTSIGYTSRPKRNNEIDGVTYNFCTKQEFENMIKNDDFYDYKEFRGWYYGFTKQEFETSDIFILTPLSIMELSKEERQKSIIFYIDINENIRFERLSKRNDADSVERRIRTDNDLFDSFTDYDIRITNPLF